MALTPLTGVKNWPHTFRFTYHTERYNLLKGATVSCNKKMNRRILPLSCLCTILWPQYRYHICCFQLPPRSIRFALPKYCNHASTIHIRSQRFLKLQWRNVTEFSYPKWQFTFDTNILPSTTVLTTCFAWLPCAATSRTTLAIKALECISDGQKANHK